MMSGKSTGVPGRRVQEGSGIEKGQESRLLPGKIRPLVLLQALMTYAAVSCQLEPHAMIDYWGLWGLKAALWNLTRSFPPFSFSHFLLLPGFCLLYTAIARAWDRDGSKTLAAGAKAGARSRAGLSVHLPAALFAAMMVLGWSFARYQSWNQVLTPKNGQLVKSLLVCWGYEILFRYLIQYAYLKFATGFPRLASFRPRMPGFLRRYRDLLVRKPFRTVLVTLLILYLPLMIVSFPGLIVADTVGQVIRGYPELAETVPGQAVKLGSHLDNHHPVAHTLLIHLCLVVGSQLLHSWNAGYYLYAILQELAFICVIAFLVRQYLRKYGVSLWYAAGILIYVVASPLIHNYVILNTKDVYYSLFLLMTVYFWYQALTDGSRKDLFFLLLFATGVILFRNEGQYVLLLAALLSLLLCRKTRKRFLAVLLYVAVFSAGYFHLLFPALGIRPGSTREMLSVPLQQTARYVKEHGDQVTPEEREAIDAVLDYDGLAEIYNPELSDPVKDTYRDPDVTAEKLIRYLGCWARMGLKQPVTYLAALVNNKYEYFYPDKELLECDYYRRSGFLFSWTTELTEKVGVAPAQPVALQGLRDLADSMKEWLCESSPLSVMMTTSLYPFFTILLLCYSLRKRNPIRISMALIPLIVLLVCMTGPTNGVHSRYIFPLALIWPFFDPILRPAKG